NSMERVEELRKKLQD
nr:RecName: Full=Chitin-binding protein HM30 [Hydrangea macrophylla]